MNEARTNERSVFVDRGTHVVAGRRQFVGALDAILWRGVAVALDHQAGGAPDLEFGYHAIKNTR